MGFFIGDAMAATAPASAQVDSFSFIMIGAILFLGYFMLIRPQNKRAKEHRELLNQLKKGDEVITTGGILAKIVNLDEQYIKVSPADGVEINIQKAAVTAVLPKGTLKSL
jgi:preprotein translocase subunit YajC